MLKSPPANKTRTPRTTNRDEDLEKGNMTSKPKPGWLAEEKGRSRSSSREDGANKK